MLSQSVAEMSALVLLLAPIILDAAPKPCVRPAATTTYQLDLVEVPIAEVARLVACFSGRNLVHEAEPKGRVTVYGPAVVRRDEVTLALRSALDEQGWILVERGRFLMLRPASEAAAQPGAVRGADAARRGRGPARATLLLRAAHVPLADLQATLVALASKEAAFVGHAPGRLLLVTERADNARRLVDFAERVDVPTTRPGLRLYTVRHADVEVAASHVRTLLGDRVRLSVDDRSARLLVVATSEVHAQVARVLTMADIPGGNDRAVRTLRLDHAKAADVAKVRDALQKRVRGR